MSLPTPPPLPPAPDLTPSTAYRPLPPAPPGPHGPLVAVREPTLQSGQLTSGWRNLLVVGWIAVVLAIAAVWKSAWTLGFPTWWLGPQSDPRFPLLLVLPFVLPVIVVVGAIRNVRYVVVVGVVAAIAQALIAVGDLGRQDRFALVEFAIAASGLAISLAAIAGLVAAAPTRTAAPAATTGPGASPAAFEPAASTSRSPFEPGPSPAAFEPAAPTSPFAPPSPR